MVWRAEDPQGNEAAKIKYLAVHYTRGKGVDIGCGQWKAFPHFIGVDSGQDYGGKPVTDIHGDGTNLGIFGDEALDFVYSSHFLEHVVDYKAALREWWRVIKPGGHLVLYLPHKEHYPNIGAEGANVDHKHDFMPADIVGAMTEIGGWDCLEDETRSGGREYSFFQVYRKRTDSDTNYKPFERNPGGKKRCLVVRYGGFGDMLMASSILPGLKKAGFHLTMNTTSKGQDIVLHDPHIDEWLLQEPDQVPNVELLQFFHAQQERYDYIVNLCEVVEGSLLALHSRVQYSWPAEARRRIMGTVNYLERHHDTANLPHEFAVAFYETEAERKMAQEIADKSKGPLVLWVLTGSSHHKLYPWSLMAIAWLIQAEPTVRVMTIGGPDCAAIGADVLTYLKAQNVDVSRFIDGSGEYNIRQTIAIAKAAACVVGSETGVLNAVCLDDVGKVVMLSHSSKENLTKHWRRVAVLEPSRDVACYPCHRMFYPGQNENDCPKPVIDGKEQPFAKCAASIGPRDVVEACRWALRKGGYIEAKPGEISAMHQAMSAPAQTTKESFPMNRAERRRLEAMGRKAEHQAAVAAGGE